MSNNLTQLAINLYYLLTFHLVDNFPGSEGWVIAKSRDHYNRY